MKEKKGSAFSCLTDILNKAFFIDFLKGAKVTVGYGMSKVVTLNYPDREKWIPYQRWRGRHTLNRNPEGKELCVACELCSKACPTNCITVIPMEDDTGRGIADRVAKVWEVDLVRCLFCGFCQDACPTTAVRLGREYELACKEWSSTKLDRLQLLEEPVIPEALEGGVYKARFIFNKKEVKVVPDLTKKRKNFW